MKHILSKVIQLEVEVTNGGDREPPAAEKACQWQVMIRGEMLNLTECTSSVAEESSGVRRNRHLPPRSSQLIQVIFRRLTLKVVVVITMGTLD